MTTINPLQTPDVQTPAFKGNLKNKMKSLLTVNPSKFIETHSKPLKRAEPQTLSEAIESHVVSELLHATMMPPELWTENQKNLIKKMCAKDYYKKISS